ncbi:dihydrolipoyllysine-residue acetyltransferase [Anopheles sinensis]|uniref:Dihydrolipoyllysine-residue acetyltransferase n=1 Tax=Anopheles sinensis TaxID=74873 RepID=A0A084VWQ8_ANOSI|nr:dihydrolipoyllysine-residue acetyltransferase [Anopheles sinensis]
MEIRNAKTGRHYASPRNPWATRVHSRQHHHLHTTPVEGEASPKGLKITLPFFLIRSLSAAFLASSIIPILGG